MYYSDKAVYADANGKVVAGDSPDAAFLVVAAGGTITDEQAAKYGLTGGAKADPHAFHDNTVTEKELKNLQSVVEDRVTAREADAKAEKDLLAAKPAKADGKK